MKNTRCNTLSFALALSLLSGIAGADNQRPEPEKKTGAGNL